MCLCLSVIRIKPSVKLLADSKIIKLTVTLGIELIDNPEGIASWRSLWVRADWCSVCYVCKTCNLLILNLNQRNYKVNKNKASKKEYPA